MTKPTPNQLACAILSTLAETDEGTPESNLYLACGMDAAMWAGLRGVLLRTRLISISNHFVELTPTGRKLGDEVLAALAN